MTLLAKATRTSTRAFSRAAAAQATRLVYSSLEKGALVLIGCILHLAAKCFVLLSTRPARGAILRLLAASFAALPGTCTQAVESGLKADNQFQPQESADDNKHQFYKLVALESRKLRTVITSNK